MADINIYLRNALNDKENKAKLVSAKHTGVNAEKFSVEQNITPVSEDDIIDQKLNSVGKVASSIIVATKTAQKIVNFGVDMWEARTGQSVRASNIKATGRAHTSFYLNQVVAGINYYLTGRHRIKRQNMELEYGRELYNMNYLNKKQRY